jgi:hypothetical protein
VERSAADRRAWRARNCLLAADFPGRAFKFPGLSTDQVDSMRQALGYEPSGWTDESLDNYNRFLEGVYQEAVFARLAGRPW